MDDEVNRVRRLTQRLREYQYVSVPTERPAHASDSHLNFPPRYSFPIPGSQNMTREEAEAWAADFMKPDKPFPFSMERDEAAGITRITFTGDDGQTSTITIPRIEEERLVFCLEGGC